VQTQKSRMVNLAIAFLVTFLPWPHLAEAQQPKKVPRVGFLIASAASAQEPRLEGFKRGLRELGYVDGQNVAIEVRSGEGRPEQLPVAAAELVSLKVEVIVSGGPTSTCAAKQATNAIPSKSG
jgi:putative ABC transport system substrate-binding protein